MATPFTALYPFVRTILGDTGAYPLYSNDQLDLGLRLGLLQEDSYTETTETEASGDQQIEPDVTAKVDKLRLAVRAALAMIRPSSDLVSYTTPSLSVRRQAGFQLKDLERILRKLDSGGAFAVISDTEFDQFYASPSRLIAALARISSTSSQIDSL